MKRLEQTVAVIIGGTAGIGKIIGDQLEREGAYRVVTSRKQEKAQSAAGAGEGWAYQPTTREETQELANKIRGLVVEHSPTHTYIVWVPGMHELEKLDPDRPLTREEAESQIRAEHPGHLELMESTNVREPIALYELLQDIAPLTYLYISSQAAESWLWDQGNSIYGPHKKEVQDALRAPPPNVRTLATQYPFFRSDTGDAVYEKVIRWDEGLRGIPKEDVFATAEETGLATAELLITGESPRMERVDEIVYRYSNKNA